MRTTSRSSRCWSLLGACALFATPLTAQGQASDTGAPSPAPVQPAQPVQPADAPAAPPEQQPTKPPEARRVPKRVNRSLDDLLQRAEQAEDEAFISKRPDWMRLCHDDPSRELERRALTLVFEPEALIQEEYVDPLDFKAEQERASPEAANKPPTVTEARTRMLAELSTKVQSAPCLQWASAWLADVLNRPKIAADALDRVPPPTDNDRLADELVQLRTRVLSKVGTVELRVFSREDTTVALDGGEPRPLAEFPHRGSSFFLRLRPGLRVLDLAMPRHQERRAISIEPGQTKQVRFEPASVAQQRDDESVLTAGQPAETPSTESTGGFGLWPHAAFVTAGVAVGAGIFAAIKAGERGAYYDDNGCATANHQGCGAVKTEQKQAEAVTIVSFVGAGLLAGVGVALLLLEPNTHPDQPLDDGLSKTCTPRLSDGRDPGITCHWAF